MATVTQGIFATDQHVDEALPHNWRASVARWYPQGTAKFTAATAMMRKETIDSYRTTWWTQGYPIQVGDITDIFADSALTTPIAAATTALGTVVYAQVAQAFAREFRKGHEVRFQDPDAPTYSKVGRVVDVNRNGGANSWVAIELRETDAAVNGVSLINATRLMVIGSSHSQAAPSPVNLVYHPENKYNLTQINRTALKISGTALNTTTRFGSPEHQRQREDAFLRQQLEMEKTYLFGVRSEAYDDENEATITTMDGMWTWAMREAPDGQIVNYHDLGMTGVWVTDGWQMLMEFFEILFRKSSKRTLNALDCYCGSGVALALTDLAAAVGHINITPDTKRFGLGVSEWRTPFGSVFLQVHPLFNIEPALRHSMLFFNGDGITHCPMRNRDLHFKPASTPMKKTGEVGYDGIVEEYLCEDTIRWGIGEDYGIATNIGVKYP